MLEISYKISLTRLYLWTLVIKKQALYTHTPLNELGKERIWHEASIADQCYCDVTEQYNTFNAYEEFQLQKYDTYE